MGDWPALLLPVWRKARDQSTSNFPRAQHSKIPKANQHQTTKHKPRILTSNIEALLAASSNKICLRLDVSEQRLQNCAWHISPPAPNLFQPQHLCMTTQDNLQSSLHIDSIPLTWSFRMPGISKHYHIRSICTRPLRCSVHYMCRFWFISAQKIHNANIIYV